MDNIPENAALGTTLATGGAINMVYLVAIFVSFQKVWLQPMT
ncbi:MAG: hypothetical protein WA364_19725 [Candidatus Nitrosopolaris sp.]